jgi:hypothetical protein
MKLEQFCVLLTPVLVFPSQFNGFFSCIFISLIFSLLTCALNVLLILSWSEKFYCNELYTPNAFFYDYACLIDLNIGLSQIQSFLENHSSESDNFIKYMKYKIIFQIKIVDLSEVYVLCYV